MRLTALPLTLLLLFAGCGTTDGTIDKPETGPADEQEETVTAMPAAMPEDFDFAVQFGIGSRNEIDTFNDTVTKDLISNGTALADIKLTDEEMQLIYENMRDIDIMETKELIPDINCMQEPHEVDIWTVKLNGETVTHEVSQAYCELTEDGQELLQLRNFILGLIRTKEEYQELPEAAGGYA